MQSDTSSNDERASKEAIAIASTADMYENE